MLPVGKNLLRSLRVLAGRVVPTVQALGSGREKLKGREVTIIDREVFDLLCVECGRDIGAIRLQLWQFARHLHRFRGRSELNLQVDTRRRIDIHNHILRFSALESLRLNPDGIRIRHQVGHRVVSAFVGRRLR